MQYMETADTDFLIQFEDNFNDETLAAFDNLSAAIKDLDSEG